MKTHEEKIKLKFEEFPQKKILKSSYSPLLYRFLWKLGFKAVRPISLFIQKILDYLSINICRFMGYFDVLYKMAKRKYVIFIHDYYCVFYRNFIWFVYGLFCKEAVKKIQYSVLG